MTLTALHRQNRRTGHGLRALRKLALAAMLGLTVAPASAATITNGSFEQHTAGTFTARKQLNAGSSALTGWTVNSGNIDLVTTFWRGTEGRNSVDLNGTTSGSISTTILKMIVGRMYNISFDMAANPETSPNAKVIRVTSGLESATYSRPRTGSTLRALNWTTMLFTTTAQATTQLLTFRSLTTGSAGAVIDNVRIALVPVPLPGTAPLALLGLAGLALLRRRKMTQ